VGTLKQRGPGAEKCAALVGVADTEQPAGAQNTPQFVECDVGVREVVEDAVGEHGVEGCIVEAQFGQVTLLEGHIGEVVRSRKPAPEFELFAGDVDTGHMSGRYDLGQANGDGSGATAAVQRAHPRLEMRQEELRFTGTVAQTECPHKTVAVPERVVGLLSHVSALRRPAM